MPTTHTLRPPLNTVHNFRIAFSASFATISIEPQLSYVNHLHIAQMPLYKMPGFAIRCQNITAGANVCIIIASKIIRNEMEYIY